MSTTAVIVSDGCPTVKSDVETGPRNHEPEDLIGFHLARRFAVDEQRANAVRERPIA
jgi:hypothetical protein